MPVYNPTGGGSSASNDPQPSDFNLETWAFDPITASATITPTAGTIYVVRMPIRRSVSIATAQVALSVGGSGVQPLANCFVGLYDRAGTLRLMSADQASPWSTGGVKTGIALASVGGNTGAIDPADGYCWLALLIGTQATTAAVFRSSPAIAGVSNMGLNQASTPPARSLQLAGAATTLPTTTDVTTYSANNTCHYCAFGT